MRLAYYAGASTAAAAACLLKAFHERPNFYSATVYLSQSNACLLILTNLLLVGAVTFMYCLQRLLYGPLRPIEIEQLSEKAWYAVLDTLLAMPSFREDVGAWLLTMFVLLLAGKVWGWIAEGRVDILEQQPPANPRLFHARLATSLLLSVAFDLYMTFYCFETIVADPRPGMMVIFTFEFAILALFSSFTLSRYMLDVIGTQITKKQLKKAIEERKQEIRAERAAARQNDTSDGSPAPASPPLDEPIEVDENEVDVPGWEEKRQHLFALEVITDFCKLVLYVVFFTVSVTFNGLPMHIMRDVYMTFASFSKRIGDYMNYKKATSDMNARYPDATTTEIRDDSCIVCRETMVAWDTGAAEDDAAVAARARRDEGLRAKKLPCGHILHLRCLKAWLERQQVCPTCRRPVLTSALVRQPHAPAAPAPAAAGPDARQAQPAAAPPANNAPPHFRPNRARFFNIGPIRVGFLNGPAQQINDLVNQMQGGAPRAQADNNAARAPAPAQTIPASQHIAPINDAHAVQSNIAQMQHHINQEAERLALDRTQLGLLGLMNAELHRLRALQAQRGQQQIPSQHNAPAQQQSSSVPSATILSGRPEEAIGPYAPNLPPGVTLPVGWSLMPLYASQTSPQDTHSPLVPSTMGLPRIPATFPAPPMIVHHTSPQASTSHGQVAVPTPPSQPPVSEAASAVANGTSVPTNGDGSPLFVPNNEPAPASTAQTSVDLPSAEQGPPSTGQSAARLYETAATHANPPWAAQSWTFNPTTQAAPQDATGQNSQSESSSAEQKSNEGNAARSEEAPSGRSHAVQVEEVPDSQN